MDQPLLIPVMKYRKMFYVISIAIIVAGIASIAIRGGLKLGIDFAGGNLVQVEILDPSADIGAVRQVLEGTGYGNNVQRIDDPNRNLFILKTLAVETGNSQIIDKIKSAYIDRYGDGNVVFERVDIVGPKISKYLLRTGFVVLAVAIGLILLYVAFRFQFRFGVSSVVALFHDVLIMLAFISLFGKEMDTFQFAAILTIIGYSINDTIVVFDRVRENRKTTRAYGSEEYAELFSGSISQTFSRTLLTAATTLVAIVALWAFGGVNTRDFAFSMTVGVISGTYSSIFVASALVVDWHVWKPEKVKKI
jgi:preprotein translocase subunit SecF